VAVAERRAGRTVVPVPEPDLTPQELIARAAALKPLLRQQQAENDERGSYSEELHDRSGHGPSSRHGPSSEAARIGRKRPGTDIEARRFWITRKPETHLFSTETCSMALL